MMFGQRSFLPLAVLTAALALSAATAGEIVRIKSFGYPELSVWNPCGLIEGTDGQLYGTSTHGGNVGFGSVFRINKSGGDVAVLHGFWYTNDGGWPVSRLLEATNGMLYGTTSRGGISNAGTIFRINKNGTDYEIIHDFLADTNGDNPLSALIQGQDGLLYGTTRSPGTIFKLSPDGDYYEAILRFANVQPGVHPDVGLLQANNGSLYGAAGRNVEYSPSVLFKVNPDGSGYQELHEFDSAPSMRTGPSELVEGDDGRLYGTTIRGGDKGAGTIFSLNPDGTDFRVLHQFAGGGDGELPSGKLIKGANGLFYGITAGGGSTRKGTLFVFDSQRSAHKVLRSVGSRRNPGEYPADLVLDSQGPVLYGVTAAGGTASDGVLFRYTPDGKRYENLRDFMSHGGDGVQAGTRLGQGPDGMVYGTTTFGGRFDSGTIFRFNPDGTGYEIVWNFQGGRKPHSPVSVVVDQKDGTLYGTGRDFSLASSSPGSVFPPNDRTSPTTGEGGGSWASGSVFRLNTNGTLLLLHRFSGKDGSQPNPLLQGSDGYLYGTTPYGGYWQAGVIFKLRNNGSRFQVLHSFSNGPGDGGFPGASLIEARDGVFYGTTSSGFTNGGTVFAIGKSGEGFNLLHLFPPGAGLYAPLLEASDGKLYGSTYFSGSIFRLNKDGSDYEVLHDFPTAPQDALHPSGPLVEGPDGAIYGTTEQGGEGGGGTVFKLNKDGSDFEVVYAFIDIESETDPLGARPMSGLFRSPDGAIFGTTSVGGDCGDGTVFRVVPEP